MELAELDALIGKTATLMVQYERRGAAVDARLQELCRALDETVARMPELLRTSAGDLVHSMPGEVADGLERSLERPLYEHRVNLQAAGDEVTRSAHLLAAQLQRLQRVQRLLVWKAVGTLAAVLALLLGGGAWLAAHYATEIRSNEVAAELMQAYNRADVVLCGKGELCANVDPKRARYGEQSQYLPVRRR